jgi:NADH-quinone oxidoreductase subunit J
MDSLLHDLETLLLLLFAAGAVAGAALMIFLRQPMRVAVALIITMLCLGAIYGLLGVHFIAAFQVLLYVGAVMVFMVYVIMLLDVKEVDGSMFSRWTWLGGLGFALLLGTVLASVWRGLPSPVGELGQTSYGISRFSVSFLRDYWLQFELTSVLLLAAVIAALAVIRVSRKKATRHG